MKHFLTSSDEDTRTNSSSNFGERLWHEYYSAPFRMGNEEAGRGRSCTAYKLVNGIPMMISPVLRMS